MNTTAVEVVVAAVNEATGFSCPDVHVAPDATLMDVLAECIEEEKRQTGVYPQEDLRSAMITDQATGRSLDQNSTLEAAGVQSGAVLSFMPKMVAAG